jgi:hypothetical protein
MWIKHAGFFSIVLGDFRKRYRARGMYDPFYGAYEG